MLSITVLQSNENIVGSIILLLSRKVWQEAG
jgi:hypothetical protein